MFYLSAHAPTMSIKVSWKAKHAKFLFYSIAVKMDLASTFYRSTEHKPVTMHDEEHQSLKCECYYREIYKNGKTYYVFYRRCVCHRYSDKSREHTDMYLSSDLENKDGIDIHEQANCEYRYFDQRHTSTRTFQLHCYCTRSRRNMRRWT